MVSLLDIMLPPPLCPFYVDLSHLPYVPPVPSLFLSFLISYITLFYLLFLIFRFSQIINSIWLLGLQLPYIY